MRHPLLGAVVLSLAACLVATVLALTDDAPPAGSRGERAELAVSAPDRRIHLQRWDARAQWRAGRHQGTSITRLGRLALTTPVRTRSFHGRTYEQARWTSPWISPGFSFTELIPSWSARTARDSWIEIRVRGRSASGRTSWDRVARWADDDRHLKRHSFGAQTDDGTRLAVDTWRTAGLASYQVRVLLHRRTGKPPRPSLDLATVMTSRLPATAGATSAPGVARGIDLPVPRYSQMTHTGHYPQWGGGGEAWCSPTSASMVLGHYDALPAASAYAWVPEGHAQPWVDHAARMSYDHVYDGTGNWPFTTAYAAPLAGKGFVTRLRSLREAERLVRAGIPPVVSIAFDRDELAGAPIAASSGHLLVVRGFTTEGDVIVNDPAARTHDGIRRVYRRGQFERLWLEASGGLAYVIHDAAHPLPASSGNW